MKCFGIAATVNDEIISFSQKGKNYIPHINGYGFFPDKEKEQLLHFGKKDKKVFAEYINNIKDGSIVVIGENTFNDAFLLFKRILKGKNITFIISNSQKIVKTSYLKDNWDNKIISEVSYIKNLNKEKSKKRLLSFATKEAFNDKTNIYVMGGKSVYEAFSGIYNNFIINNLHIENEVLEKIKKEHHIIFNKIKINKAIIDD